MNVKEALKEMTMLNKHIATLDEGLKAGQVAYIGGRPLNVFEMVVLKRRLEDRVRDIENMEIPQIMQKTENLEVKA